MRSTLFRIPVPDFLQSLGLPDGIPVFGYGMMILIAFLLCTWIAGKRGESLQVSKDRVQDISTMTLLAGLVGARLLHIVLYPDGYETFLDIFKLYRGGLVLYGALLTSPLMIAYKLHKTQLSWDVFFKIFVPVIPLGIGIGRLGCFLNGCCFGKPGELPWCVIYPKDSLPHQEFANISLHPSQIYAFVLGCLQYFLLVTILKKVPKLSGRNLGLLAMMLYGCSRLVEEFYRADTPRHFFDILTAGQAISLLLLLMAPIIYIVFRRSRS